MKNSNFHKGGVSVAQLAKSKQARLSYDACEHNADARMHRWLVASGWMSGVGALGMSVLVLLNTKNTEFAKNTLGACVCGVIPGLVVYMVAGLARDFHHHVNGRRYLSDARFYDRYCEYMTAKYGAQVPFVSGGKSGVVLANEIAAKKTMLNEWRQFQEMLDMLINGSADEVAQANRMLGDLPPDQRDLFNLLHSGVSDVIGGHTKTIPAQTYTQTMLNVRRLAKNVNDLASYVSGLNAMNVVHYAYSQNRTR